MDQTTAREATRIIEKIETLEREIKELEHLPACCCKLVKHTPYYLNRGLHLAVTYSDLEHMIETRRKEAIKLSQDLFRL